MTFQKAMSACDITSQQMSRVVRILNELVRSEASTPLVCRMIQEAIESQGKGKTDQKLKKFLQVPTKVGVWMAWWSGGYPLSVRIVKLPATI